MREINELSNSLLYWVDHHPRELILSKFGGPMTSSLEAEVTEGTYKFYFSAFSAAQGNGSCIVKVTDGKKVLLDASGNFTVGAYNMKAKVYEAGDWEKKIPKWK